MLIILSSFKFLALLFNFGFLFLVLFAFDIFPVGIIVQRVLKVLSDSPGVVYFAIGLVNSVLNLPDGQVKFFEEFRLCKNCVINPAHQKVFGAS